MYSFFIIVLVIALVRLSQGTLTDKNNDGMNDHSYGTVSNPNIAASDDCALRAFTIEMATYIQPNSSRSNWTALSESGLQMYQCNVSHGTYEPSTTTKPFEPVPGMKKEACLRTVFVHDENGDDSFEGTFDKPMKTIQAALSFTRVLRTVHGSNNVLCITIRGGTYYLGTNATTTSSQIGELALTSNDSNLVIENYQDERVVLSGGTLLKLQWSVHAKITAGGTIMKATVPISVNLDQFNELYIDERRAIVAKYPNGDPATQGLYAKPPGFAYDYQSWFPSTANPSMEIHVLQPNRSGTVFPNYQLGLGGGASVFDPPSSFWSTAKPPAGTHVVDND